LKAILYGTELLYKNKIIYYSFYNYKTGKHLCHYCEGASFFPKTISLNREDFRIRREEKDKLDLTSLGSALI
jgi:hypothetical protein